MLSKVDFIPFFKRDAEAVNSPLKGSIRTAAGTAAGSGPRTGTTFCRLLLALFSFLPPPPPPPPAAGRAHTTKSSRKFLPAGARHLVHYALLETAASWGGGGRIHPLVPVTHAMWAAGQNPRHCNTGVKSLWTRMREKIRAAFWVF